MLSGFCPFLLPINARKTEMCLGRQRACFLDRQEFRPRFLCDTSIAIERSAFTSE
jgi:hypothetical protein